MHDPHRLTSRRPGRILAWSASLAWLAGLIGSESVCAVEFHPTVEAARQAGDPAKPVLLTFTSASCGWCRKLATSTFADERVAALGDRVLWVKADIDEQPALAAKYRVRGVPHTFVIDRNDRVLASQPGYLPAEEFVSFVTEGLANPQPIDGVSEALLDRLANLTEGDASVTPVTQAVELLSRQDAAGRGVLLKALQDAGPPVHAGLVALLADERLAVRAAAASLLKSLTAAEFSFDPFADPEVRSSQIKTWQQWLARNGS